MTFTPPHRQRPVSRHRDRAYEGELNELRTRLVVMAERVGSMIEEATGALVERNSEMARGVVLEDRVVNREEIELDELCMLILAKRQPMASDLRFVTMALKMVTDLERIGDLAVNVAERAIDLNEEPILKPYRDVPQMAHIAQEMLREAIDAFVAEDADLARSVIARDDEVDELYHEVFRDLLDIMADNPDAITRAIHIQAVAKFLERIGDHSTNLAEQVVHLVKGKDIRHRGKRAVGKP